MPQGGLSMFGAGLQLQQATPGVLNSGNANLSGDMLARQFSTNSLGAASAGNENEIFGSNINQGTGDRKVMLGKGLSSPINSFQVVVVGYNSSGYSGGSATVGHTCISGGVASFNPQAAFGASCFAGSSAGSVAGNAAFGINCTADLGRNVAFGSTVVATNSTGTDALIAAFGIDINFSRAGHTENIAIGKGITEIAADKNNTLTVGYYNGSLSGIYPGTASNSILIGNAAQTKVKIGPYTIGNSTGAAVIVNDANHVIAGGIGTVIFNTLTAARTVTLPLANSLPAGSTIKIADFSGNCSAVNTITALASGADTILDTNTMKNAFDFHEYMTNGVDKWLRILDKTL